MPNNLNPEVTQLLLSAAKIQQTRQSICRSLKREQQRALAGVIARIRQSLDLETIFKTTAIEVRSLPKVDSRSISLLSRIGLGRGICFRRCRSTMGFSDRHKSLRLLLWHHCVHYQQGKVQAVADIHNADLSNCQIDIWQNFKSEPI